MAGIEECDNGKKIGCRNCTVYGDIHANFLQMAALPSAKNLIIIKININ
jgi:hypothetical protein